MPLNILNNNMYKFNKQLHIHTLDGQPLIGTSTMSSVLAKPLTWWASGLAVEKFGWINKGNVKKGFEKKENRIKSVKKFLETAPVDDPEEWLKLCDEAYSAHSKKLDSSASAGTDMHSVMESYVKECIENNEGKPLHHGLVEDVKLKIFTDWAEKNVKKFLWSEAHCYSKELWLGGISDCGFEDMEGKIAILDFKSSKEVYLSQFWQCVGYAIQIEENGLFTPEGELIMKLDKPIDYVAVLPFGMDKPEVQFNFDMVGGKKSVASMVQLYKALN